MSRFFDFLTRGHENRTESSLPVTMLVGLGNPGREYRQNRHNIGFMALDRVGDALGIACSKVQNKSLVGSGIVEGHRIYLVKPQTFMNLSGQAVTALVRFYKIQPDRLLVIHDDLDLTLGALRLRPGGSSGGQKGLASIIAQLGSQEFARLRLGIGRPPGRMDPADYVLQDFSSSEKDLVAELLDKACEAARVFITSGLDAAMNQFNQSTSRE